MNGHQAFRVEKNMSTPLMRHRFFQLTVYLSVLTLSQLCTIAQEDKPVPSTASLKAIEFIDLLATGEFEKAVATFDATMAKVMPAEQLKKEWQSVAEPGGKLRSRSVLKSDKLKQGTVEYEAVIVACDFEKRLMESRLVYSADGKLSGMFFRPAKPRFVGKEELWIGELNAGVTKLRILIHLGKNAEKKDIATFDSLDQNQKGIAFDVVTVDEKKVKLELKAAGIVYEGTFSADRKELSGSWKQGLIPLTLKLKPIDVEPEAKRPQTPKGPFPYDEHQVTYDSLAPDVKLAGTLTVPKTKGPHPAVLLITGSGSQDRDETIFEHKPFWVIADHLTRRGIAVLRVDDRGVGGSKGTLDASSADFAEDVKAGIEFLKTRTEIDSKKIGLLGHSEGGMIALMIAAEKKDVAFIVLLAGSAFPGSTILFQQTEAILKASGVPDKDRETQRQIQEKVYKIVSTTADNAAAQKAMKEVVAEVVKSLDSETQKTLKENEAATSSNYAVLTSRWFRFFLDYDPAKAAEKVTCSVLALNGENDLQVLPKENLGSLENALKKGGNSDFTIRQYPKLNHLFQTSESGHVSEYGRIEETISPKVLEDIGDWISMRTLKK